MDIMPTEKSKLKFAYQNRKSSKIRKDYIYITFLKWQTYRNYCWLGLRDTVEGRMLNVIGKGEVDLCAEGTVLCQINTLDKTE